MTTDGVPPRPLVVAAIPTPFTEAEQVDLEGAALLAKHLVDAGCDAVFVGGTTGEYPALTIEERFKLVEAVTSAVGPESVVAHVGAACAQHAERLAAHAADCGVSDVAAASPYFLPADDEAHFNYYLRIARAAPGARLWLYVYPEVTGNALSLGLLNRLLALPTLQAAKVSSPGVAEIRRILAISNNRLRVFSGSDADLCQALELGASGVVTGLCSVAPTLYLNLAEAAACGDGAGVRRAQAEVNALRDLIGDGVGGIKAGLRAVGMPAGPCRMPLISSISGDPARLREVIRGSFGST